MDDIEDMEAWATSRTPMCADVLMYRTQPTYVCTRDKGHDGDHVAHGMSGAALVAWRA